MNNHVRQHRYIVPPIELTLSALHISGKETEEGINFFRVDLLCNSALFLGFVLCLCSGIV